MTALVSVETVLLVLLVILVAGLLRSHAEILRRLGPPGDDAEDAEGPGPLSVTTAGAGAAAAPGRVAPVVAGLTPDGDAVALDFTRAEGRLTLLAFLTTGCSTCAGFWETLAEGRGLPAGLDTVIVTHGADRERPAGVRALAPDGVPVVLSSQAWADYRVPGAPYFVLVGRTVLGEGVATTWTALSGLVRDAVEDERAPAAGGQGPGRAQRIDDTLAAGGITPGHPSLHPGRLPVDAPEPAR